jgi:hypothetical protein
VRENTEAGNRKSKNSTNRDKKGNRVITARFEILTT